MALPTEPWAHGTFCKVNREQRASFPHCASAGGQMNPGARWALSLPRKPTQAGPKPLVRFHVTQNGASLHYLGCSSVHRHHPWASPSAAH